MSRVSATGNSRSSSLTGKSKESGRTEKNGKSIGIKKSNLRTSLDFHTSPFLDKLMEVEMDFAKEELQAVLREIETLGKDLIKNPNNLNLKNYKAKIQAFLKQALKKIYKVDNKLGLKKIGVDQKVFVSVEKIDEELEKLTLKFMNEQSEALNIISMVDGIQGLLCNIIA